MSPAEEPPAACSTIDDGHISCIVPLTGGGHEIIQPIHLTSAEFDAVGGSVFLDVRDLLGAGDRGNVVALREQPSQSDLCRCCACLTGNGLDLVEDAKVSLQVLPGEARV